MQTYHPSTNPPASAPDGSDPHLRSALQLLGAEVHAIDYHAGRLDDLLVDNAAWAIRQLVVDTRAWLLGSRF